MNVKAGWVTSEFILSVFCIGLILLNRPLGLGLENFELLVLAANALGYPISRGLAKRLPSSQTTIVGPQDTATVTHAGRPESV